MRRDKDLLRAWLLFLEEKEVPHGTLDISQDQDGFGIENYDWGSCIYHANLLIDSGFIDGKVTASGHLLHNRITSAGHDFLEVIRDPEIWSMTKSASEKAGGWSLELLGDLARGLIRTQVKKHTGIEI